MNKLNLGVDIGRVLIDGDSAKSPDTNFLSGGIEQALRSPPVDGAIEGLAALIETFGPASVWLVSKAGDRVADKTRRWLDAREVYAKTGLVREQVVFVRERADKARIARRHGLTHFIDDRVDVLGHLRGLVPHLFLFGEAAERNDAPAWTTRCPTWAVAVERVRAAL